MDNPNVEDIIKKLEEFQQQNETIARQLTNNDQQIYNHISTQMQLLYRQMEALFSLYSTLQFRFPLPQMRGWPVSPDFASILVSHILEYKPATIIELGSGISTLFCGYALEKAGGGKIISLEHDAAYLVKSQKMVEQHGLSAQIQLIHAPLTQITLQNKQWIWYDLPVLPAVSAIDLLIVDGPPSSLQEEARFPAVPLLKKYFTPQTVIFLDDAGRPDETKTVKRWLEDLPNYQVEGLETEKGIAILKPK
jgi:predicted O-methyltransferase YrrM